MVRRCFPAVRMEYGKDCGFESHRCRFIKSYQVDRISSGVFRDETSWDELNVFSLVWYKDEFILLDIQMNGFVIFCVCLCGGNSRLEGVRAMFCWRGKSFFWNALDLERANIDIFYYA